MPHMDNFPNCSRPNSLVLFLSSSRSPWGTLPSSPTPALDLRYCLIKTNAWFPVQMADHPLFSLLFPRIRSGTSGHKGCPSRPEGHVVFLFSFFFFFFLSPGSACEDGISGVIPEKSVGAGSETHRNNDRGMS